MNHSLQMKIQHLKLVLSSLDGCCTGMAKLRHPLLHRSEGTAAIPLTKTPEMIDEQLWFSRTVV